MPFDLLLNLAITVFKLKGTISLFITTYFSKASLSDKKVFHPRNNYKMLTALLFSYISHSPLSVKVSHHTSCQSA